MSDDSVIISVSEEELIVSLYNSYLIRYRISNNSWDALKMSVTAFSDYIQRYLVDRYHLDEEKTKEVKDV